MDAKLSLLATGRLLRQVLLSDSELATALTNVFPVVDEEEVVFPYIVFGRTATECGECRGNTIPVHQTYEIEVWSDDYDQSCALADKVIGLLQGTAWKDDDTYISHIYLKNALEYWNGAYCQRLIFQLNTNSLTL